MDRELRTATKAPKKNAPSASKDEAHELAPLVSILESARIGIVAAGELMADATQGELEGVLALSETKAETSQRRSPALTSSLSGPLTCA